MAGQCLGQLKKVLQIFEKKNNKQDRVDFLGINFRFRLWLLPAPFVCKF